MAGAFTVNGRLDGMTYTLNVCDPKDLSPLDVEGTPDEPLYKTGIAYGSLNAVALLDLHNGLPYDSPLPSVPSGTLDTTDGKSILAALTALTRVDSTEGDAPTLVAPQTADVTH